MCNWQCSWVLWGSTAGRGSRRHQALTLLTSRRSALFCLFFSVFCLFLRDLQQDDSYTRDYMDLNLELTGSDLTTIPFGVYTEQLEYHTASVQTSYMSLHQDLLANDKVDPAMMRSWYLAFQRFLDVGCSLPGAAPAYCLALDGDGRLTDSATFYPALKAFLDHEQVIVPGLPAIKVNAQVRSYSLRVVRSPNFSDRALATRCNAQWAGDVIWVDETDPTKGVLAARFAAGHPVDGKTPLQSVTCL